MIRYRARGLAGVVVAMVTSVAAAQSDQSSIRRMRANNTELSYAEQGKGVPVVFVHGAVGDLRFWESQRDAFARQFRFVAYTYRYHGTDPWPDEGKQYSVDTHVADLAAFISALNAGPVHLVGLSYGGMMAAMVAVKQPQLIRTLTLAEPALFSLLVENPDAKPVLEEWSKSSAPMVAAIKAGDNTQAVRQLSALVTGGSPEDFDKLPAGFRQVLLDNARTLPLMAGGPPPNITCDMLRAVRVPTLIVRGERTPRFFSRINDEVGRCMPGSKLVVVPKASHAMSHDNPAEFNRVVLEFLRNR